MKSIIKKNKDHEKREATVRIKTTIPATLLQAIENELPQFKDKHGKLIAFAVKTYIEHCPYHVTPRYMLGHEKFSNFISFHQKLSKNYADLVTKKIFKEKKVMNGFVSRKDEICQFTVNKKEWNILAYLADLSPLLGKVGGNKNTLVIVALEFMLYYLQNPDKFPKLGKLLNLSGSKWNPNMVKTVKSLTEKRTKYKYLIDPFGGALGLTMNIEAENYIICDCDPNKINLYKCLKSRHFELIKALMDYDISKEHFKQLKNPKINWSHISKPNVKLVADFLFISIASCYSKYESVVSKLNPLTLIGRLNYICNYHERLKNAEIIETPTPDKLFEFLESLEDKLGEKTLKKSLITVDPPYLDTKGYPIWGTNITVTFDESDHTRLAEIVRNFKGTYLYFYRDNKFINNLFRNNKIYYTDVDVSSNHTGDTERILTNKKHKGMSKTHRLKS